MLGRGEGSLLESGGALASGQGAAKWLQKPRDSAHLCTRTGLTIHGGGPGWVLLCAGDWGGTWPEVSGAIRGERSDGRRRLSSGWFEDNHQLIMDLALKSRLPALYVRREYARSAASSPMASTTERCTAPPRITSAEVSKARSRRLLPCRIPRR